MFVLIRSTFYILNHIYSHLIAYTSIISHCINHLPLNNIYLYRYIIPTNNKLDTTLNPNYYVIRLYLNVTNSII